MSSTRSTKSAEQKAASPSSPAPRRGLMIGAIIAALVVIALVVAVLASGGDDDGGEAQSPATTTATGGGSGTTSAPATDAVGPAEQQPVTVQGTDLVPLEDEDDDAAVGATPPTVDGFTFDGTPMRIAPGGTAKMVVFLAHWCPHCNAEIPIILDWAEEGMVPDGLEIVGVATGTDDTAPNYPPSTWLQELGWTFDTLADSPEFRAAQAYGVTGFPFFAIVGEDGTVLGRFSGEKPLEELDATVRGALGV